MCILIFNGMLYSMKIWMFLIYFPFPLFLFIHVNKTFINGTQEMPEPLNKLRNRIYVRNIKFVHKYNIIESHSH